jgi:phage protein D
MPPANPSTRPFSARPTVQLDGQESERLAALLTGMVMHEREGGLASLELRLTNVASLSGGGAETAFDAGGDLELGAAITVGGGDAASPVELFRGTVTGLEAVHRRGAPPELVVLAEDALQKARLKRRSQVFENVTVADIVRRIAGDHGLTPQITGLDQDFGPQVQMNETDLGFLRRLLARVDADLQVVGNELQVAPRAEIRRGEVELDAALDLHEARVLADLAHQVTATTVRGWDATSGQAVSADGAEDALGPGGGERGGALLEPALGSRAEHTGHLAVGTDAEARALANATRNGRARRFVTLHAVAAGNPALRVGTQARVAGLGRWFANTFYVVETRHLFDLESGYRTEFRAECAYLGTA